MITKVCFPPSVYTSSPPPKIKLLVLSVEMEVGNLNQFSMAIHFLLCFWFIFFFFDLDLASDVPGSFWKLASLLVLMASLFPDPFLADCATFVMFLVYHSSLGIPQVSAVFVSLLFFSVIPTALESLDFHYYLDYRWVCHLRFQLWQKNIFWLLTLDLCFNNKCFLMLYLKVMFYFYFFKIKYIFKLSLLFGCLMIWAF